MKSFFGQKRLLSLRLVILGFLLTLTGATALVSEQIFEKYLSTVVGASTPASAIVLAVFFLGLTAGAAGYGLLALRVRRPFVVYARLEGFVAAWSLLLALFFPQIQTMASTVVLLAGESPLAVFVLRFLVACAWILPPSIAAGSTFPAVVAALRQLRVPQTRRLVSRFYAVNLLGAVFGAAATPYVLFPRYGLSGTLGMIAAAQGLVFLLASTLGTGLKLAGRAAVTSKVPGPSSAPLRALLQRPGGGFLIAIAFISGLSFFSFEVLWIHLIRAVIGTSVYAFGVMLTVVLAGLFIGGWISSIIFGAKKDVPGWTVPLLMALSVWALSLTFRQWDKVAGLLLRWGAGLTTFGDGELLRFLLAAMLIGPPAIVLGMIFPSLFRHPSFPRAEADAAAGFLSAVNSVGCVLGALATGFLLLPAFGSERVYRVLTFLLAVLALAFALSEWFRLRGALQLRLRRALLAAIAIGAVFAANGVAVDPPWNPLALTSGVHVYFRTMHIGPRSRLLFWHEDTFGGFTTVVEDPRDSRTASPPARTLLTNGKFQGNDQGEMPAQIGVALIPILHQPRRERALVIGLGTGQTAHVVAASGFRRVDIAEIAPGIVLAARRFFPHVNQNVLEVPAVHLAIEDGRNYLLRSKRQYDLITIELNSVWFAGASNLYSREFYALARQRLAPDGVLQQWIQFHHISPAEVISVIGTLRSTFGHVTVWYIGTQAILVASPSPLRVEPAVLEDLQRRPALAHDLRVLREWGGATSQTFRRLSFSRRRRRGGWRGIRPDGGFQSTRTGTISSSTRHPATISSARITRRWSFRSCFSSSIRPSEMLVPPR